MSFPKEHELHTRRRGRNIGVGLVLGAFIAIVFGLTIVKLGDAATTQAKLKSGATNVESNQ